MPADPLSLLKLPPKAEGEPSVVLRLLVRNHPGVMSHVCGLFARRAFNLDAIVCFPVGDGRESRMWLRVAENGRLNQIVEQVKKLHDVREVEVLPVERLTEASV